MPHSRAFLLLVLLHQLAMILLLAQVAVLACRGQPIMGFILLAAVAAGLADDARRWAWWLR